ncbi:transposase [Empedobacter brevis]|uniref:transposase n=1 Tax=Empedobacter brevis TaxID=247 RepID=UPI00123E069B|nr:transposase [Empedobacter brevis]QES93961.1 transposase [Empedobacter brevis]
MKKKFYSEEFKDRAVQQRYQRDNIKELTDELEISPEKVYKWRTDYKDSGSSSITEKTQEHF